MHNAEFWPRAQIRTAGAGPVSFSCILGAVFLGHSLDMKPLFHDKTQPRCNAFQNVRKPNLDKPWDKRQEYNREKKSFEAF